MMESWEDKFEALRASRTLTHNGVSHERADEEIARTLPIAVVGRSAGGRRNLNAHATLSGYSSSHGSYAAMKWLRSYFLTRSRAMALCTVFGADRISAARTPPPTSVGASRLSGSGRRCPSRLEIHAHRC